MIVSTPTVMRAARSSVERVSNVVRSMPNGQPSRIGVTPNRSPATTSGKITTLSRFCHHGRLLHTRISPLMRMYSDEISPTAKAMNASHATTIAAAAAITASVSAPASIASTMTTTTNTRSTAASRIAMPRPNRLMPSTMPSLILSQVDFSASCLALAAISPNLAGALAATVPALVTNSSTLPLTLVSCSRHFAARSLRNAAICVSAFAA